MDSGNHSTMRNRIGFIGWMLVVFVAAAIGAFASVEAGSFYGQLVRPDWAPPAWLFGPVWSFLYVLMGIAAWLVWRDVGYALTHPALKLFFAQLALNALWSWLFFAWHLGALAVIDVLLLVTLIAVMLVWFWRINHVAGYLIAPYFLWVCFATALCVKVWQLNPQAL